VTSLARRAIRGDPPCSLHVMHVILPWRGTSIAIPIDDLFDGFQNANCSDLDAISSRTSGILNGKRRSSSAKFARRCAQIGPAALLPLKRSQNLRDLFYQEKKHRYASRIHNLLSYSSRNRSGQEHAPLLRDCNDTVNLAPPPGGGSRSCALHARPECAWEHIICDLALAHDAVSRSQRQRASCL
jgi:hypothetical protein